MKLHIQKNDLLSNVQKEFGRLFPYLRISFYRFPHKDGKLSPKDESLGQFTPIGQLVTWSGDKVIEVNNETTISQFESALEQIGLFVQVFRKSGRVWIETSYTDDWSLQKQNEEGEMLSSIHNIESDKQVDWDE